MIRVILFMVLLSSTSIIFAAEVTKIKGKGALIDLKGDSASPGDVFYAVKPDGKRAAIIKINKVKGDKAIGKILKGKADVGYSLEAKPHKSAKHSGSNSDSESNTSGGASSRSYWGGLFGFAMDSMDANVNDYLTNTFREKVSLSGNAFSAKGLFDYEIFPQVWFRGTTGLEGFSVSGSSVCGQGNIQGCKADIYYLSFDFIGRYVFSNGNFRPWLGGGIGLLFPLSKDATVLDSSSISTTNVIIVGGGGDWFLSPNMYIPVSIEYGLLPKSDEVSATWIALRAGFAVPF